MVLLFFSNLFDFFLGMALIIGSFWRSWIKHTEDLEHIIEREYILLRVMCPRPPRCFDSVLQKIPIPSGNRFLTDSFTQPNPKKNQEQRERTVNNSSTRLSFVPFPFLTSFSLSSTLMLFFFEFPFDFFENHQKQKNQTFFDKK